MINLIPTGEIITTIHYTTIRGRVYPSYQHQWRGGDMALIHAHFLEGGSSCASYDLEGVSVRLGVFLRIRVIQYQIMRDSYIVMRGGWKGKLFFRLHKWLWKPELFYRRLIIAASVFNLADCPAGTIPSWRQLKWFREE